MSADGAPGDGAVMDDASSSEARPDKHSPFSCMSSQQQALPVTVTQGLGHQHRDAIQVRASTATLWQEGHAAERDTRTLKAASVIEKGALRHT